MTKDATAPAIPAEIILMEEVSSTFIVFRMTDLYIKLLFLCSSTFLNYKLLSPQLQSCNLMLDLLIIMCQMRFIIKDGKKSELLELLI